MAWIKDVSGAIINLDRYDRIKLSWPAEDGVKDGPEIRWMVYPGGNAFLPIYDPKYCGDKAKEDCERFIQKIGPLLGNKGLIGP